jgi:hypothetical protein
MGIIRNSIDITGITPEDELPQKISGQLIEYSEVEHIYIPEDRPRLGNIHQISIDLETTSHRIIKAPTGRIIVLDGIKKLKIIYSRKGYSDRANIVNLQIPFNTFIELPKTSINIEDIGIHIVDAYFNQIEARKLYSYTLYMVNVVVPQKEASPTFHHNVSITTPMELNAYKSSNSYSSGPSYLYNENNILEEVKKY